MNDGPRRTKWQMENARPRRATVEPAPERELPSENPVAFTATGKKYGYNAYL
jgi:hypothetical protein